MSAATKQFRETEAALNTVAAGLSLAAMVINELKAGSSVQLDFVAVERMTPSFANALVMTILDAVGVEVFRTRVSIAFSSTLVQEAWMKAVERYERGIRLSTQRPGAA